MNANHTDEKKEDEIVGYVRLEKVTKWDYEKRFKATISTPLPNLLLQKLKEYLPEMDAEKDALTDLLDLLFDYQKTDMPEAKDWLIYDTKETSPPKDDRILQAINIVRKKNGKPQLTWTHLVTFIASKEKDLDAASVERTISDWIEDVMPPRHDDGDFTTWVTVVPIKLLPDESIKRSKPIPIPKSVFDKKLKEIEAHREPKSGKDVTPDEDA